MTRHNSQNSGAANDDRSHGSFNSEEDPRKGGSVPRIGAKVGLEAVSDSEVPAWGTEASAPLW